MGRTFQSNNASACAKITPVIRLEAAGDELTWQISCLKILVYYRKAAVKRVRRLSGCGDFAFPLLFGWRAVIVVRWFNGETVKYKDFKSLVCFVPLWLSWMYAGFFKKQHQISTEADVGGKGSTYLLCQLENVQQSVTVSRHLIYIFKVIRQICPRAILLVFLTWPVS